MKLKMFLSGVVILFLLTAPLFTQNESESIAVLDELVKTAGTAMREEMVLEKIQQLLPENANQMVDEHNNLHVTIGSGEPELMFIAHMDEIGLEVAGINEDGTVAVRGRGGFYSTIWESRVVKIYTKNGIVDGIVPPRKSWLEQNPQRHSRDDILIYTGADSKSAAENLGIQPGDFAVQTKRMIPLENHRYAAGSTDDRAGCAAQILALKRLMDKKLNKTICFVWCIAEEIGLIGSRFVAKSHSPDIVFAVDTFVSSDAPRDSKTIGYAPLGNGAVLRFLDSSNITPKETFDKIRGIAQKRKIPVQWGISSGGNDGSSFLPVGSIDAPLSWPGIHSHSFISVIDMRDFDALVNLIVAIAEEY